MLASSEIEELLEELDAMDGSSDEEGFVVEAEVVHQKQKVEIVESCWKRQIQ